MSKSKRLSWWHGTGIAAVVVGMVALAFFASGGAAYASAFSSTTSFKFPISLSVFVPCAAGGAGEIIDLSGTLHEVDSVTLSNSGNFHLNILDNPQQLSGLGETTGAKYQGTGETRQDITESGAIFPLTENFVNNFRMIGQGPGNNFAVHENAHITVNANGVLTSNIDNLSITCQ